MQTNGFWDGSVWPTQRRFTYGEASRLKTVGDGTNFAGYGYVADSPIGEPDCVHEWRRATDGDDETIRFAEPAY
jgi:hypothetical protein